MGGLGGTSRATGPASNTGKGRLAAAAAVGCEATATRGDTVGLGDLVGEPVAVGRGDTVGFGDPGPLGDESREGHRRPRDDARQEGGPLS